MKACIVLDMFKTFIRSAEFCCSAINKSSKCERCFDIKLVQYSYQSGSVLLVVGTSVFQDCPCISYLDVCDLLQYLRPNMIVRSIVKVGG